MSYIIDGQLSYPDAEALIMALKTAGFEANLSTGAVKIQTPPSDKVAEMQQICGKFGVTAQKNDGRGSTLENMNLGS